MLPHSEKERGEHARNKEGKKGRRREKKKEKEEQKGKRNNREQIKRKGQQVGRKDTKKEPFYPRLTYSGLTPTVRQRRREPVGKQLNP